MKILTNEDRNRYNEFLEKHERCNFQQATQWQKVKTSWINEVVIAENDNGEIIGSISVLIRKIPIFGNICINWICDNKKQVILKQ